jgi:hypothetical protein
MKRRCPGVTQSGPQRHQRCCASIFIPADHSDNSLARDGTLARLRDAPRSRSLKTASMILSPLFCWIDKTLQNVTGDRADTSVSGQSHRHSSMRRRVAVAPRSLWFRLTLLLASLTGMATTVVGEVGARCGVVGMI